MRKKSLIAFAGAFFLLGAGASLSQQPWQHMQNLTAADAAAQWKSPQPEYGPEPYFGLNGPVRIAEVDRDLDTPCTALGFKPSRCRPDSERLSFTSRPNIS